MQGVQSHQQPIHSHQQQQHMQGQHMQGQHMQGQYQQHHQYQQAGLFPPPRPHSAPNTSNTFQASTPAMMTQAKDSSIPSISLPSSFNLSQVSNIGVGTGSGTMTGLLLADLENTNNPAVSQPAAVTESTQAPRSTMNTPTTTSARDDEEDEEAA
jgi:hypothetical protein